MSRALRMNDVNFLCFVYLLLQTFATNHHNYARWMVCYQKHLINIEQKYPGPKEMLGKGGLSIKGSQNSFAGTPGTHRLIGMQLGGLLEFPL